MIKKCLYFLAGFSWGICAFNMEILIYAIIISIVAIVIDVILDD